MTSRRAVPSSGPVTPVEESFDFPPWKLTTIKNHILPSRSSDPAASPDRHEAFHKLSLPHLPDMVFPDNIFRMGSADGSRGIEFNALDALKRVDDSKAGLFDSPSSLCCLD